MKFKSRFEFASASLPGRWNAIGMIIAGCVILLISIAMFVPVVSGEFNGHLDANPDQRWPGYFDAGSLGIMALVFLTGGGWLYKISGQVTTEELASKNKLTTSFTKPDGSTTTSMGPALGLYHWIGRILTTIGCAMYAAGFYTAFVMQPPPNWDATIYFFCVGSLPFFLGLFFLWYRRRIRTAVMELENTL